MKIIASQTSKRKRIAACAAAVAFVPAATAFVTPSGRFAPQLKSTVLPTSLPASTLENPTIQSGDISQTNAAEEIVDNQPRTTLDVRIHGTWYDLTGWRKAHPAGDHWIDWYDGRDATEVMDAFHSEKARNMFPRMPKTKPEIAAQLEAEAAPDSETQKNFRKLFNQLEKDGWWERNIVHESKLLGIWGGLVVAAAFLAKSVPGASTFLLSLSMTAAGWLGHDYIHGIDPFAMKLRNFAAVAAGLLPVWWSDKHNKHHALSEYQIVLFGISLMVRKRRNETQRFFCPVAFCNFHFICS